MTDSDLVGPLQTAMTRADPNWVTQPSHLRRRLEEELGTDARRYRAQIHQLIVAAEERVPIRLRRNGWSPTEREELVNLLVGTRGWTNAASEWTVATWAAALGLTDERPAVPPPVTRPPSMPPPKAVSNTTDAAPSRALIGPTEQPSQFVVPATELPSVIDPVSPTDDHVAGPTHDTSDQSELPPASGEPVAVTSATSSADLPRMGMRKCTKKTASYLETELDVAYEVKGGPTPALLLLALPIGLAAFALPALSGALLMTFIIAIGVGRLLWPSRILAISGDQIWLLSASRVVVKPTGVIAEGTRDHVDFAGGWPFPSVRVSGQRLWFMFPVRSAARRIPTTTVTEA